MISVLIVEDDPMVRNINEKFLEKIENTQLLASVNSIKKAKEVIDRKIPDLVLLDIFFPEGRGQDLLQWIRSNDIKTDVILITADKSVQTVEQSFRFGAVDYLIKPFSFERFREALNRYKERKYNLRNIKNVEQEIIDKYVNNDNFNYSSLNNYMDNKNFSKHTYDLILNYIKRRSNESFTAQEVADELGVSRITARRYLDLLEKEKILELELEYGKVGRPKNKYKLNK